MSIAGGYYKAADAAAGFGMETVQLFTKNNNQWRAKPLSDEDVQLFREAIDRHGLKIPCAHDSYLINLASPNDALWKQSLDAFIVELERAEALGLAGVVMHPGSYVDSSEEEGLQRIVKALDLALKAAAGFAVQVWLEVTAGQGTNLGHRFEHLRCLIDNVNQQERLGVCLDTCHIFAAGYPLHTKADYEATFQEFDDVIGLARLRAMHLNDSKKPLGSRVDRHHHIGEGCIGTAPFEWILNDPRFDRLPMYLETKKEKRDGEEMDAVNLRTLRGLLKPRGSARVGATAKKKKAPRKNTHG
jgi:deoxyribonuclease-4